MIMLGILLVRGSEGDTLDEDDNGGLHELLLQLPFTRVVKPTCLGIPLRNDAVNE
jgi:hypothetical protein